MRFQISLEHLNEFAGPFWELARGAKVFAFHGQMGAGKTTIITALCRHKGVKSTMSSPTFSIINEYEFESGNGKGTIFHIDLYRLSAIEEIYQAGVQEAVESGAICFIEWPEKAPELFDDNTMQVFIEPVSETERTIEVKLPNAPDGSIE